jgi:hypothetical protein
MVKTKIPVGTATEQSFPKRIRRLGRNTVSHYITLLFGITRLLMIKERGPPTVNSAPAAAISRTARISNARVARSRTVSPIAVVTLGQPHTHAMAAMTYDDHDSAGRRRPHSRTVKFQSSPMMMVIPRTPRPNEEAEEEESLRVAQKIGSILYSILAPPHGRIVLSRSSTSQT